MTALAWAVLSMTAFGEAARKLLLSSHATSVWPLLVVPGLVYGFSRPLSARIARMAPANGWTVWLAFCAAAAPGVTFLGLAVFTLSGFNFRVTPGSSWACFVHCYGLAALFLVVVARAAFVVGRHAQIRRLLALAGDPSPRLAILGAALHLPVREVPTDDVVCLMAGILRPVVCVSRGTLAALSDDEMRAALLHERAHWRRHDTLRASIALFLNECSILPVRRAFTEYRRAAEFAADQEATKETHPFTLASALLRCARYRLNSPAAISLAGHNLNERAASLLGVGPGEHSGFLERFCTMALLVGVMGLASLPYFVRMLEALFCAGKG
jgi:Zn-dependent protease with chaperone function